MAYHIDPKTNKSQRKNPKEDENYNYTSSKIFVYSQQAAIITDEAHHGGGDVAVYAQGPYTFRIKLRNFLI